jgi:hypothetical protein
MFDTVEKNHVSLRARGLASALASGLAISFPLWLALSGCGDNKGPIITPALELVSVDAAATVAPGGSLAMTAMLRNSGGVAWPDDLRLELQSNPGWDVPALALPDDVAPGATVTVTQTIDAATQIGFHRLSWVAVGPDGRLAPDGMPEVALDLEVTCDDGVFCNGDERYVGGACAAGPAPCDDGEACTTDECDEQRQLCARTPGVDCASCDRSDCTPSCDGKVCGSDGCGGVCGEACADGLLCIDGQCEDETQAPPGTCLTPLPLLAEGVALIGTHVITGDTSTGIHSVSPTCNAASDAKELVYTFTIDQVVGIDARMSGLDSVLDLRLANCQDTAATVYCSDDATPPGEYGSRVATMLQPGTYYLIADAYNALVSGPFTLSVRFTDGCVPACDGRFCGDDGCGGVCGDCAEGEVCTPGGRCLVDPCVPACDGRECGSDGCGGMCGACENGELCVEEDGQCRVFPKCDHDKPTCEGGCSATQFCGFDCRCHEADEPRADLVVGEERLASEISFETRTFDAASCAVFEGCVGGMGERKLLRFEVYSANQGRGTFVPPQPSERPDLFEFSPCHGHYHFKGFAQYAVLDADGNVVAPGHKQAYCLIDSEQHLQGPTVACGPQFDCENQGLQGGWADTYSADLDCQWVDVTGVPPGEYRLQVTVNPDRLFDEVSYENNTSSVPVTIE